jgi:hypothetical protein
MIVRKEALKRRRRISTEATVEREYSRLSLRQYWLRLARVQHIPQAVAYQVQADDHQEQHQSGRND